MDFNFGSNNDSQKPEEDNNMFSFNPENNDADTLNSDANNSSPFEWTPDEAQDSDESIQSDDEINVENLFEENNANDEISQLTPDIPDGLQEDVLSDVADADYSDQTADQETSEEPFEEASEDIAYEADGAEEPAEEGYQGDDQMNESEETENADFDEAEIVEDGAAEDGVEQEEASEQFIPSLPEQAPAPAALDKRVRIPDSEQEFLLSELIDVETGEPLDLTSLIPEELLTASTESAGGFSMGIGGAASQPTTGGFDMSAGTEAPSKRKRPARPKAPKKKGGGIVGVLFGAVLAFLLFPYVMAILEMCGVESNFPIPAPGIPTSYKHIPEWWPEWAMFMFPGRTTDAAADNSAEKPAQPAPAENANPADNPANEEVPSDDANAADEAAADEAGNADEADAADNAAAADDGAFDPDAFLANDEAENAVAEDVPADQPAEPGVVNAPQYTSADVSDAVSNVAKAYSAAKSKIDDSVYAALNDMAEKSTFVDTSVVNDQLKDAMSKVRKAMGNFGSNPVLAATLSEKWAARAEDESDDAGVLFVGKLSEVSERDGYQINTINLEGQDGSIEVVGLRKIKPVAGDKVVVCGKRIANPEKNLGGFTDNGLPVIWGGIVIKAEDK